VNDGCRGQRDKWILRGRATLRDAQEQATLFVPVNMHLMDHHEYIYIQPLRSRYKMLYASCCTGIAGHFPPAVLFKKIGAGKNGLGLNVAVCCAAHLCMMDLFQ
jgi:hypothetical protein